MDETRVRQLLERERTVALARVRSMQGDLDGIMAASDAANGDDEHDPEGATIAYERAQVTALLARARTVVDDLDRALARLADGTYALCETCQGPIGTERLAARPAARTCFACAGGSLPPTG